MRARLVVAVISLGLALTARALQGRAAAHAAGVWWPWTASDAAPRAP